MACRLCPACCSIFVMFSSSLEDPSVVAGAWNPKCLPPSKTAHTEEFLRNYFQGHYDNYVANASALYRGQNPQNRERGFRGQKTPISQCSRKGRFESKNPHVPTGLHKENGDFSTQIALFWGIGKWEFFDPETLFPDFGDFDPCTGPTRSQHNCRNPFRKRNS